MLHKEIQEEIKRATLAKEKVRLEVLRGLQSAFTNELVANKRKPSEILHDEDAIKIIRREARQRQEAIEQFKKGGRDDLIRLESEELKYLEKYLPQMMSEDEIIKRAKEIKKELKIIDKANAGVLVGAIMQKLKGQADGTTVKKIVDSFFD